MGGHDLSRNVDVFLEFVVSRTGPGSPLCFSDAMRQWNVHGASMKEMCALVGNAQVLNYLLRFVHAKCALNLCIRHEAEGLEFDESARFGTGIFDFGKAGAALKKASS